MKIKLKIQGYIMHGELTDVVCLTCFIHNECPSKELEPVNKCKFYKPEPKPKDRGTGCLD